jgi:hypothetical protein
MDAARAKMCNRAIRQREIGLVETGRYVAPLVLDVSLPAVMATMFGHRSRLFPETRDILKTYIHRGV